MVYWQTLQAAARDAEEQYLAMESEAGRLLEENAELAARWERAA